MTRLATALHTACRSGLLAASIALLATAAPATAAQLHVTQVPGVAFPNRTFVLSVPQTVGLTSSRVHVTENGRAVTALEASTLGEANAGALGVVLVIDSDPSMAGAPLNQAMLAARALAAQRTGTQQLGAIFGDGRALALSSSSDTIRGFLAQPPHVVRKTNLLSATQLAINELKTANVVAGAVIYVSDDMDEARGLTPQSLAALANAAHVRIFTVAVRDAATNHPGPTDLPPSSMRTLAASADGTYNAAVPTQLRGIFTTIEAGLMSQYVVRYRSNAPLGKPVMVAIRVDGVPGLYQTAYRSPAPPPGPAVARPLHQRSFWASSAVLVIAAVACALLIGLVVAAIVGSYARLGRLQARVHAFVPQEPEVVVEHPHDATAHAGPWARLLETRRWWPTFVENVNIAGLSRSPRELVRFAIAGSALAAVVLQLITGSLLVAILGLAVGPLGVRAFVRRKVRQQRMLFAEQLPAQLHELATAMRTGRSLVEGVGAITDSAEEPMRRELERVLVDERAGLQLDEALVPIAKRMESAEIEQLSVIAALHRRTGATIAEVLDRIAGTARQRVEIRRELMTMTAQARLTRNILTALPFVVAIAIDIVGHDYERPLFHTTGGVVVIAVGLLMMSLGVRILKAISNVEE